jgi:uncharacterized protein involved in outer membrane biogenesis
MDPRDSIPPFLALQEQLAPAQTRRRRERIVRNIIWSILGGMAMLFVIVVVVSRIDPNSFRGRIEAAVQQATGRAFKVNGNIRITSWWRMTLVADDVTLANAAWGSRKEMLKLGRIEADVALFPLFSGLLRLPRLALYDADLLLERDASGQGNWQFAHPAAAANARAAAAPAGTAQPAAAEPPFAVRTVHLRDLKVSWKESPQAEPRELLFRRLSTSENLREGNVSIGADVAWRGQPINLAGSAGSLIRLMDPAPPRAGDPPWGLLLTAQVPGAKVTLAGTIQRPLEARGLSLRIDGVATDLSGISAIYGRALPPLRAMTLTAQIADRADGQGGAGPQLQNINMQIGASDLAGLVPGLKLERVILSARNPDDAIQAEFRGTLSATDLRATGRFGTLAQLVDPERRDEPFPVELNANLGESTLSLRGLTAPYGTDGGAPTMDMAVALKLRDLADFSAFAGRKLPTQRPIAFEGRVATIAGEAPGIALRGATLRMPLAELEGDVDIILGARPEVRTVLHGRKLDADGMIDAVSKINFGPPSTELPKGALPIRRTERPVISDTPLELGWMDVFDADVSLALDELTLGGLAARTASLRVVMKDGRMTLTPFTGTLPGGVFTLRLSADSRVADMPVALRLAAPALDVRPMLLAMGRTEDVSGLLEVDADLTAAGRSPHALAGSMTGHLALAMVDGTVDNALMQPLLGGVMRAARVPSDVLFGPGRSRLRCFAARMNATNGDASLSALALDVGRTLVEGSGSMRFEPETVDIRIRPQLRITADGITVPLKLTGRFRAPALEVDNDKGSLAKEALGALSALSGRALGTVGNRNADACATALAVVRTAGSTQPGPAAPPPPNLFPNLRPPPPADTPTR